MNRTTTLSGRSKETEILAALMGAPRSNEFLKDITPRYGARIYDLRKKKYRIATRLIDGKSGLHLYTLVSARV